MNNVTRAKLDRIHREHQERGRLAAALRLQVAELRARLAAAQSHVDAWRGCPDPGCRSSRYTFATPDRLWRHLVERHGADPAPGRHDALSSS